MIKYRNKVRTHRWGIKWKFLIRKIPFPSVLLISLIFHWELTNKLLLSFLNILTEWIFIRPFQPFFITQHFCELSRSYRSSFTVEHNMLGIAPNQDEKLRKEKDNKKNVFVSVIKGLREVNFSFPLLMLLCCCVILYAFLSLLWWGKKGLFLQSPGLCVNSSIHSSPTRKHALLI